MISGNLSNMPYFPEYEEEQNWEQELERRERKIFFEDFE